MAGPNVLLVVLDTARADALEPYGAPAGASPAVAQLASRGRAHHDIRAPSSWTVPSHASMFTGLLPRGVGLTQIPGGRPHGARPALERHRDRLLAEVLRRHGYATGAISTNLWLTERTGFDLGFDRFASISPNRQRGLDATGARQRAGWLWEALRARVDDGAADAGRLLRDWIARRPDRPFFWFINLVECHSPYLPPRPYNDLPALDRLRAAAEAQRHLTLGAIWRTCAGRLGIDAAALGRMRALYAASIRYMDAWLADVLETLDQAGALDDTLVVVTSDHGENFGEGGLIGHAFSVDDRLLHVPFVTAGPVDVSLGRPGSLTGLPAALADALGLDEHPWEREDGPGLPVAQFDPPAGREDPRVAEAIEAWGLGEEAARRITTSLTAVTDGRLKLVRDDRGDQLFDLAADPLEAAPLNDAGGPIEERAAALRAAIDHPAVWRGPDDVAPAPVAEPDPSEVAALERQMRLLGYL